MSRAVKNNKRSYVKKEINYRKLTKMGSWAGFFFVILMGLIVIIMLIISISAFMEYMINEKLQSQFATMATLVTQYENADEKSLNTALKFLDHGGHDYYILDSETGEVIHSKGEVVLFSGDERMIDIDDDSVKIEGWSSTLSFYTETDIGFIRSNGLTNIDLIELGKAIRNGNDDTSSDAVIYSVPVWIETAIKDGREVIFTKLEIAITRNEVSLAFVFFVSVAVITALFQIVIIVNIFSNVVKRRKALKLLFSDMVTGGRNKHYFIYRGNQIIRRKKNRNGKYAIVSLKIVNFKNFTICHSLAEGEEMLRRISAALEKSMNRGEFCTTAGSSSFAMLIKNTDEESLKKRITDIISMLETLGNGHKFTFHAGVAIVTESYMTEIRVHNKRTIDAEKVYTHASLARDTLTDNDNSGVVMLSDALIAEQMWVDTVRERQQSALSNEEFLVYYQPKYDPKTEELSGAEALVRWQSPEFGFVTPNRFIPIFEQNGFITELDHYMIRHAARDQKRWLDSGFSCVPVSVNVSRAHFIEPDLAEQIRDLVDSENCPHDYIEIELTESAFFDDKKALVGTINKLKEYGFAVSMDDFGAGYSSLNSLKDMPLDVLKLDGDFFRGNSDNDRGQIVVEEAIKLAKRLSMRTVAEGIETKDQVEFLATQGCDMIQGYYYAKPLPSAEYEKRMSAV